MAFKYILFVIADIKIVLTIVTIVAICVTVLIFPIFVNISLFYPKNDKKIFFGLGLYGINLIGGYAEKFKKGISVFLNGKKRFYFYYKNMFKLRAKIKPLRDYHFISIYYYWDLGLKNTAAAAFSGFTAAWLTEMFFGPVAIKKPYIKAGADINIYECEDVFDLYFKGTVALNLLALFLSAIKILTEKMIYAIRKTAK